MKRISLFILLILLIPLSISAAPVLSPHPETGEPGYWLSEEDMTWCLEQGAGRAECEDCLEDCQADKNEVYDIAEALQKDNERLGCNQKIYRNVIIGIAVYEIVRVIIGLLKR